MSTILGNGENYRLAIVGVNVPPEYIEKAALRINHSIAFKVSLPVVRQCPAAWKPCGIIGERFANRPIGGVEKIRILGH
jgi:hypothetical protein